jgi:hypothetical protein
MELAIDFQFLNGRFILREWTIVPVKGCPCPSIA